MSKAVTYRLPPYVDLDYNPHYTGGDTNYAPIKLRSLGDYPLGVYTVHTDGSFGGQYTAVSSTNNSVTLVYPGGAGNYPAKRTNDFMDVNTYGFAYKEYSSKTAAVMGISGEAEFNPYIFDFDAFEGQDTARFNQIEIVTDIMYGASHIPNWLTPSMLEQLQHRGQPLVISELNLYGYAVVYFPDMPGFDRDRIQDPTGVDLLTASSLSKLAGMYLIIITDLDGVGGQFDYRVYPDFPNDRNVDVLVETIGPVIPNINNQDVLSGARLTVTLSLIHI